MEMANEQAEKMEKDSYEKTNTVKNRNKQMSKQRVFKNKKYGVPSWSKPADSKKNVQCRNCGGGFP